MSEFIFTDENFAKEVLKSNQPVLVDFFAPWCGPCKIQGPIIKEVAQAIGAKAKVGKLNVDDHPVTAEKFGIMSVPTIIIFKGGKAKAILAGVQSKEILIEKINKLL